MKRTVFFLLVMMMMGIIIPAFADEPLPTQRTAVVDKVCGACIPEPESYLKGKIQDSLVNSNWTIVVRGEEYNKVSEEHKIEGIDPSTRVEEGMAWGATDYISVEINMNPNVSTENSNFNFIVNTSSSKVIYKYSGTITLSLIDVKTKKAKKSVSFPGESFRVFSSGNTNVLGVSFSKAQENSEGILPVLCRELIDSLAATAANNLNSLYNPNSDPTTTSTPVDQQGKQLKVEKLIKVKAE